MILTENALSEMTGCFLSYSKDINYYYNKLLSPL